MNRFARRILVAALAALMVAVPAFGLGAWRSSASGQAVALAHGAAMPAVAAPNATLSGGQVVVSWTPVTFAGTGTAMTSYLVSRYPQADGKGTAATVTCAAGSTASSCVDATPTASGGFSPSYTVTPLYVTGTTTWSGAPSPATDVQLDPVAPTTTATFTPDTAWSPTAVTVALNATDATAPGGVVSGVKSITYAATGAQTVSSTTVTGASAGLTVSTSGSTTVTWSATDNAGNVEATQSQVVGVDAATPTVTLSDPPSSVSGTAVGLTATVGTQPSGVASVSFAYATSRSGPWTTVATVAPSGTTATATWDTTAVTNGTYYLEAVATSGAGLSTTSATRSTAVANPEPTGLQSANRYGGHDGRLAADDTLTVSFAAADQPRLSSLCSGWTGSSSLTGLTVTVTHGSGDDTVTAVVAPAGSGHCGATATAAGPVALGTVDLGSASYLASTATFTGSSLAYSPSGKTLTLTFGTLASGTVATTAVSRSVLTLWPGFLDNASGTPFGPLASSDTEQF